MSRACLLTHPKGTVLRVRVTPNAARSEPTGLIPTADGSLRLAVRIKAPPVDGKANAAVRRWAADTFGLRQNQVELLRGERAREKDLLLIGLAPEAAEAALRGLLPSPAEPE